MNFSLIPLLALISLAYAAQIPDTSSQSLQLSDHQSGNPCGATCRFRFCRRNNALSVSPIGRRLIVGTFPWAYVCDPNGVNIPGRFDPPRIEINGTFVDFAVWAASTNTGAVSPNLFNADKSWLRRFFLYRGNPGPIPSGGSFRINVEGASPQLYPLLNDRCLIVPLRFYTTPTRRVTTRDTFNDCVSFRTNTPKAAIELRWFGADDLDIVVTEPNGDVLDSTNPTSTNGRLVFDVGSPTCDTIRAGREVVVYDDAITPGVYTISIVRKVRCPQVTKPRFSFRMIVNGVSIGGESGFAWKPKGQTLGVVRTISVTVPPPM